jgi:hypothetical protein
MERLSLEHTFRWLVMEGVLVLAIPFERRHECAWVLSPHFSRLLASTDLSDNRGSA